MQKSNKTIFSTNWQPLAEGTNFTIFDCKVDEKTYSHAVIQYTLNWCAQLKTNLASFNEKYNTKYNSVSITLHQIVSLE